MKTLSKSVFGCWDKNQLKFCRKSYWNKQPFNFTVYLMNHDFQTSARWWNKKNLTDCVNIWKTSEAANLVFQWIFVLNSVKQKFLSMWVSSIRPYSTSLIFWQPMDPGKLNIKLNTFSITALYKFLWYIFNLFFILK